MRSVLIVGYFMLCCISSIRSRVPIRQQMYGFDESLLPSIDECGIQGPVQATNRIVGGHDAAMLEFPWMAFVETTFTDGISMCGGSLISKRYVLSAAHCITSPTGITLKVVVTLGEHDMSKPLECVTLLDGQHCKQLKRFNVERAIPHERYDRNSRNYHNDIALLKLPTDVQFTDTIRPICLSSPVSGGVQFNEKLVVAGWGRTETNKISDVLRSVEILVPETCAYAVWNEIQICTAGEVRGSETCFGDSGGPLMKKKTFSVDGVDSPRWFVEGIVSSGQNYTSLMGSKHPCPKEYYLSTIFTRVSAYIPWIYSHITQA